jgi:hypothetical protein
MPRGCLGSFYFKTVHASWTRDIMKVLKQVGNF